MEILEGMKTLFQELNFSVARFIESLSQKMVWIIQPFRKFAFSFVFQLQWYTFRTGSDTDLFHFNLTARCLSNWWWNIVKIECLWHHSQIHIWHCIWPWAKMTFEKAGIKKALSELWFRANCIYITLYKLPSRNGMKNLQKHRHVCAQSVMMMCIYSGLERSNKCDKKISAVVKMKKHQRIK